LLDPTDLSLSFFDNLVDPDSIMELVVSVHVDIGKLTHHDRTPKELQDAAVYFYKWIYVPPSSMWLYGSFEEIPLPTLGSYDWPLPDRHKHLRSTPCKDTFRRWWYHLMHSKLLQCCVSISYWLANTIRQLLLFSRASSE
jgi:hypothetical protein